MEDNFAIFKLDNYGIETTIVDIALIETLPNEVEIKFAIGADLYVDHGALVLDPLLIEQPNGRFLVLGNIVGFYVYVLRGFDKTKARILHTMPTEMVQTLKDQPLSIKSRMANIIQIFSFFSGEFTDEVLVHTQEEKEKLYNDIAKLIDVPVEYIRKIDTVRMYAPEDVCESLRADEIDLEEAFARTFEA